jgi:hypothetical protein
MQSISPVRDIHRCHADHCGTATASTCITPFAAMRKKERGGLRPSTLKHDAFYFRNGSTVIHHGPYRNLYPDRLTVLVTANRHNRLGQRTGSRVYIPRKTTPMARMRLRRNDQFNRISNCLELGKSEKALGGRAPMIDRSISGDPDDCSHCFFSAASFAPRMRPRLASNRKPTPAAPAPARRRSPP